MKTTFIGADQNWQDESTTYWFDMDGEVYGVVEGGNAGIVDSDGMPIDYNDALRSLVERNCIVTVEALEEGLRAIGDHHAPGDCYATGPMTGDPFRDLVQCPACSFIAMCDDLLAAHRKQGGSND